MNGERGSFALGVVVGLLLGLSLALGVALYITKAPVPFINKVPQRTAEQDQAEQMRNRNWDPNAPLAGKVLRPMAAPASAASEAATSAVAAASSPASASAAAAAASRAPGRDAPAAPATAPQAAGRTDEAFVYYVQAGAYSRAEEAEQQRARLAMLGLSAKITEREQSGRTVYRVRIGPHDMRADAEAQQSKLQSSGVESQLVRVEKP